MQPGPSRIRNRFTTSVIAAAALALVMAPLAAVATAGPAAAAGTTVHVDAGATKGRTTNGVTFVADRGYTGGKTSTRSGVSGSRYTGVYGSVRHGMSAYDLAVANGRYDVTLRFVEPYFRAAGKRVFDVKVEGKLVLDNFDVYRAAGGRLKAHDRTFRVDVTGGRLDLDFSASRDRAVVSAISVRPAPSSSSAPAKPAPAPAPAKPAPAPPKPTPAPAKPAPAKPAPVAAPVKAPASGYAFGPKSVWRQSVANAPLHPSSAKLVKHLHSSITKRYGGVAAFNAKEYNASYYVVDSATKRTNVKYSNCQGTNNTHGLFDGAKHFMSVPIPSNAVAAAGSDGALSIYSPSTDQLWEFWKAEKRGDGWYACWGGRIDSVSTNIGHFSGTYGTTATGLPHAAGQISLADIRSGKIEHAVGLVLAEPRQGKARSWPAQRSDGWVTSADAVPHGLRLRLDPSVDVSKLDLHPIAAMVARAAQKYGFITVDSSGATGVYAESGLPEKARTGTDPWPKLLAGTPQFDVMRNFPWDKVQAMPVNYGKP